MSIAHVPRVGKIPDSSIESRDHRRPKIRILGDVVRAVVRTILGTFSRRVVRPVEHPRRKNRFQFLRQTALKLIFAYLFFPATKLFAPE